MNQKIKAKIIKGIGGFYYVEPLDPIFISHQNGNQEPIECKARGALRHQNIKPIIGDLVEIEPNEHEDYVISDILPRKNSFIRPSVANVDTALLCFALTKPKPDLFLLDKLLVYCQINKVDPVLVFTKKDTDKKGIFQELNDQYQNSDFPIIALSAKEDESFEELEEMIAGKTVFLAGPSGVGKSTLINRLSTSQMDTGGLSEKLGRGKHTTRHVELLPGIDGGFLVDTPGFSNLEFEQFDESFTKEDLKAYYPEFRHTHCKFDDCNHIKEPGCGVRDAVREGKISKERYKRYKQLFEQLSQRKMKY